MPLHRVLMTVSDRRYGHSVARIRSASQRPRLENKSAPGGQRRRQFSIFGRRAYTMIPFRGTNKGQNQFNLYIYLTLWCCVDWVGASCGKRTRAGEHGSNSVRSGDRPDAARRH